MFFLALLFLGEAPFGAAHVNLPETSARPHTQEGSTISGWGSSRENATSNVRHYPSDDDFMATRTSALSADGSGGEGFPMDAKDASMLERLKWGEDPHTGFTPGWSGTNTTTAQESRSVGPNGASYLQMLSALSGRGASRPLGRAVYQAVSSSGTDVLSLVYPAPAGFAQVVLGPRTSDGHAEFPSVRRELRRGGNFINYFPGCAASTRNGLLTEGASRVFEPLRNSGPFSTSSPLLLQRRHMATPPVEMLPPGEEELTKDVLPLESSEDLKKRVQNEFPEVYELYENSFKQEADPEAERMLWYILCRVCCRSSRSVWLRRWSLLSSLSRCHSSAPVWLTYQDEEGDVSVLLYVLTWCLSFEIKFNIVQEDGVVIFIY